MSSGFYHFRRGSRASFLALVLVAGGCRGQRPAQVECTCTYGGVSSRVRALPTREPYGVEPVDILNRFRFKLVFQAAPAQTRAINVYVYQRADPKDVLLQEVKYVPPFPRAPASAAFGFTGKQLVYSSDGREFEYYCELEGS